MRVRRYETVFILRPDLEESQANEIVQKLENVIPKEQGTVVKRQDWGTRKLAYDIRRFSKGHYLLFDYVGPTRLVAELERYMKINENVMKFLTVKLADRVDMEAIRKEREEEEKRQTESRKTSSWEVVSEGKDDSEEGTTGAGEQEREQVEEPGEYEDEGSSVEEEDEEEEHEP